MIWYNTTVSPCCPENTDWESERKWAVETGFTRDAAFIGYHPFDLPSIIKGKKRRPVNGVELPVALDHLRIYRNPKTNERVAIYHEYPGRAEKNFPIIFAWCEENGLTITQMDYSWYFPNRTTAYMISAKQYDKKIDKLME